jgi:hypothetical protein
MRMRPLRAKAAASSLVGALGLARLVGLSPTAPETLTLDANMGSLQGSRQINAVTLRSKGKGASVVRPRSQRAGCTVADAGRIAPIPAGPQTA